MCTHMYPFRHINHSNTRAHAVVLCFYVIYANGPWTAANTEFRRTNDKYICIHLCACTQYGTTRKHRHIFQLYHVHGSIIGCVNGRRAELSSSNCRYTRDASLGKLNSHKCLSLVFSSATPSVRPSTQFLSLSLSRSRPFFRFYFLLCIFFLFV